MMLDQDKKNAVSTNNDSGNSSNKETTTHKQENGSNSKIIKDLTLKLRQKQRDNELLGIDPNEILEEQEKRQPFSQRQE